MKTAETKTSATARHLQARGEGQTQPFFQQESAGNALDHGQPSFFNPNGSNGIQRKPFFAKSAVQTKLRIGPPGDKYEQEADSVADKVVQRLAESENGNEQRLFTPRSGLQRKPIFESEAAPEVQAKALNGHALHAPRIQKKCADCEQVEALQQMEDQGEEEALQMKPIFDSAGPPLEEGGEDGVLRKSNAIVGGGMPRPKCPAFVVKEGKPPQRQEAAGGAIAASEELDSRLGVMKGSGTSLSDGTREQMETAFGTNFSGVRVHNDSAAVQMSSALGAQAFTHGNDIFFNAGKYDDRSTAGKHLLAHELTHVVQQNGSDTDAAGRPEIQRMPDWLESASDWVSDTASSAVEGVESLGENIAAGASRVADAIEEGVTALFNEVKELVNSGISSLQEKWNSIQEFALTGFDTVKSAFGNIVSFIQGPLNYIANAVMNFDADSLTSAWTTFSAMVTGTCEGFKSLTANLLQRASSIWESIGGFAASLFDKATALTQSYLFKKLPDTLQSIVTGLLEQARSVWRNICDSWEQIFGTIKSWVEAAVDVVIEFVNRILSFGMDVVIEGIRQFGELVLFLKDLFANPKKYLDILAAKSLAAFDGLESRFAGIVSQYFPEEKAATDTAATGTIQRQADPGAVPEAKSSASWSDIGTGVWGMMVKKWNEFKANGLSVIVGLLVDMFFPIYGNVKDVIELFVEIKKIVTGPLGAGSLEEFWTSFLLILDIPILIYQKVVSILMRSLMVPLIVASFVRHPLVTAIASAVGYGLLGAFVQAELLNVGHKVLLLKTGKLTQDQKADAYNRIADTFIAMIMTAAIMLLLLILHFIANVMKGVYNFVKGKVFPVEKVAVEAKGRGLEGKGKGGPEEGKAGEGKGTKEAPTQDGKRKIKLNEEGKCEVCSSPCDDVRKKYASVMTPEAEAKIKAIENDPALTDPQKIDNLKPIEQELAELAKQRFEGLSKDPQTGKENPKSIDEANAVLQAEQEGLVQKASRPDLKKGDPNLDFKVEGPPPFKFADVKTPVNRGNLVTQAEGIGKKSFLQKGGASDVMHIVDLKNIPAAEKPAFKANVLKGAGSPTGIVFING